VELEVSGTFELVFSWFDRSLLIALVFTNLALLAVAFHRSRPGR
jgi:hypothetical protein